MSVETFYTWVEKRFNDNWSATRVAFDGVPFDDTTLSEYIRVTILATSSEKTALNPSPSRREHLGIVEVQIFEREQTGTRRTAVLADTLGTLFRDVDVQYSPTSRWLFYEPSAPQRADSRDPAWMQHNVTIPFMREEYL